MDNINTDKYVSIIIPVHNSKKYLSKCVDSCLAQTLRQIEIILVDDASTDDSRLMISNYAKRFPENVVPIYLNENLRQGGARNRGIEIARGEYLCFVDSDDWIEPDMCELLYAAAKNANADMAGGSCFISTENMDKPQILGYCSAELGKDNHNNLSFYFENQGYFWNRLYRRKFILENQIFFPEKLFYEDSYFNFLTGLYANRIVKVEKCFYHYYQSPNSTIRAKNQERLYDRIPLVHKTMEDCKERGLLQLFPEEIHNKLINMSASSILYNCLEGFDKPNPKKLEEISEDVKKYCPNYIKTSAYKSMNSYLRWYLNATMLNPQFAVWSYLHGANRVLGYVDAVKNKLIYRREKK